MGDAPSPTKYTATEEYRYTFRCSSCTYRPGRLITLDEANHVLRAHSKHGGTQEVRCLAVGDVTSDV